MSKKHQSADERKTRQRLATVDAGTLEAFRDVEQSEQDATVKMYESLAADRSLPRSERKIAKARADQFREIMDSK
jgi:hypothetical protein